MPSQPSPRQSEREGLWRGESGDFSPWMSKIAEGMLFAAMREGNPDAVRGYVRGMLQMGLDAQASYERIAKRSPGPYASYQAVLAAIQQEQAEEKDRDRQPQGTPPGNPLRRALAGETGPLR